MAEPIPVFFDPERPPAGGGWSYPYDPSRPQEVIQGYSADYVIQQVQRFRQNNGLPANAEDVAREVWAYWCSKEPGRCSKFQPIASTISPGQKQISKADFGIIWRYLNLAAAQYDDIGRDTFLKIVETVSPMVTCPECRAHWNQMLTAQPATVVHSCRDACRWTLDLHNQVSRRIGKAEYTYAQLMAEYGAPPL